VKWEQLLEKTFNSWIEDDQNYLYGIASFSTWKLGVVDECILSMNAVYQRTVHDDKYA